MFRQAIRTSRQTKTYCGFQPIIDDNYIFDAQKLEKKGPGGFCSRSLFLDHLIFAYDSRERISNTPTPLFSTPNIRWRSQPLAPIVSNSKLKASISVSYAWKCSCGIISAWQHSMSPLSYAMCVLLHGIHTRSGQGSSPANRIVFAGQSISTLA